MSRIGKKPINLPSGVSVDVAASAVTVKGPKGELTQAIDPDFKVSVEEGVVSIERPTDQKRHKSLHGLYRALINNMVVGVHSGYTKELELVGVGYKAAVANNVLELNLGYSHNIYLQVPQEVSADAKMEKGKNPIVTLSSSDKELIGQVAAQIRSLRKIEPYKGKGIKFVGEKIRRKAGKTAAK
ncbi:MULTISPECIES: 50S ribosomal protein L6 [Roseivirga]|uniref:50S ribosomal protein L6 n=1 Tax=Roseivirga TaxID=290180 RepID=UPI001AFFE499|nr:MULTISPECIES: 50S ribosomal protein L6 [Roseivirga]MBO6661933.1 50S ribosomal protein L6 [Roseivirga sp.]MBO6761808.1 50S ribosomal protein L6 [Roseivirga sp.]MBO6909478.1 50S ribosomal protein L6 [Roseivirga sp.]WPZ08639.1 50S ribosomal protein L6 [Roseivirga spongicola]